MQPATLINPNHACDRDLLPLARVSAFRAFLDGQNVQTRDGKGAQFFHVRTSSGWAAIQKGARETVATPKSLRAVIEDFLKAPIGKAILSSDARALFQALPTFPEGISEAQKITTLVATAQGKSPAQIEELVQTAAAPEHARGNGKASPLASLKRGAREHLGLELSNDAGKAAHAGAMHMDSILGDTRISTLEAPARPQPVLQAGCNPPSNEQAIDYPSSGLVEVAESFSMDKFASSADAPGAPAPIAGTKASSRHAQYLRDLRDDLAMNAPLMMRQGEKIESFADRCWEYANVMISRRPTMAGD